MNLLLPRTLAARHTPKVDTNSPPALAVNLRNLMAEFVNKKWGQRYLTTINKAISQASILSLPDLAASVVEASLPETLGVLDAANLQTRYELVTQLITKQLDVMKLSKDLQVKVNDNLQKTQRQVLLR